MVIKFATIQKQTVEAKIKLYVHLQRVGEAENPAERSTANGSPRVR